jgi:hypothetical protein
MSKSISAAYTDFKRTQQSLFMAERTVNSFTPLIKKQKNQLGTYKSKITDKVFQYKSISEKKLMEQLDNMGVMYW